MTFYWRLYHLLQAYIHHPIKWEHFWFPELDLMVNTEELFFSLEAATVRFPILQVGCFVHSNYAWWNRVRYEILLHVNIYTPTSDRMQESKCDVPRSTPVRYSQKSACSSWVHLNWNWSYYIESTFIEIRIRATIMSASSWWSSLTMIPPSPGKAFQFPCCSGSTCQKVAIWSICKTSTFISNSFCKSKIYLPPQTFQFESGSMWD